MEQTAVVVAGEARASSTDCDWTELPADLLVRVLGGLQIPDLFSCGGVCRSWRRGHLEARRFWLCSPQESPCLVYSAADRDDGMATLHHLSTDRLYHVALPEPAFRSRYVMGSAHGWLITADERSNLILVNPITGAQIAMPPPETMPNVELRYGEEDGNPDGYNLLYVDTLPHNFDPEPKPYGLSLEQARFCLYTRVALSGDPSTGSCIAVRVHLPHHLLSYARIGDTKWTWVDTHEECKCYVDVCYDSRDGLFYALRGCGDVHTIDLHGPSPLVNIVYKHRGDYTTDSKYIVRAPWGDYFQIWRWDRYLDDDEDVVEEEEEEDEKEDDDDDDKYLEDKDEDEDEDENENEEEGEEEEEEEEEEDDNNNDVDEIGEWVMVVTGTEAEEDEEEEIESTVEVVNKDCDAETETKEDEVYNVEVAVEEKEEEEEEKDRVTANFRVYKIDFVGQKLARVNNLQDHTLFTGFNTSFLLPVKDCPTFIPNSIYHANLNTFSKRFSDRRVLNDQSLRQVFIFNMENSSFTNILPPTSSRLNWPPPVWIQTSLS
ncbi:hypothetical protein ACQ4PT_004852 [Festuca glaucescens]